MIEEIYVGRPSKWGNPFVVGEHGSAWACVQQYKEWLPKQSDLMDELEELRGKRLVCPCRGRPCHKDVLYEMLRKTGA